MLNASSIPGNKKVFNNRMTSTKMHSHSPHKKYTSWAYAITITVTFTGGVQISVQ
jgi:hypothetical protein